MVWGIGLGVWHEVCGVGSGLVLFLLVDTCSHLSIRSCSSQRIRGQGGREGGGGGDRWGERRGKREEEGGSARTQSRRAC